MELVPTFAEAARILRPGGLFAAYNCDWPPTVNPEVERAYHIFIQCLLALEKIQHLRAQLRPWRGSEHLTRIRESGHFRFTKELFVHSILQGNAERFIALAFTHPLWFLARDLITLEDIGFQEFRTAFQVALGDKPQPWYVSYRVRLAIK